MKPHWTELCAPIPGTTAPCGCWTCQDGWHHLSAACREAERAQWADAMRRGREISARLRDL